MKLRKKIIKNTSSVDIAVRDAYGKTYMLFPNEGIELVVFEQEKKGGQCGSNSAGESGVRKGS